MSASCRVCGRQVEVSDSGQPMPCVCVAFPAPARPPARWSWLTKAEALALRDALNMVRITRVTPATAGDFQGPADERLREYVERSYQLADVVEQLLAELHHRRPYQGVEYPEDDVTLHLGGARS